MQQFNIIQNATLPYLEMEVINDGRHNFNKIYVALQAADVTFNMRDNNNGIKKIVNDKANISYNITALCVALVIGGMGCGLYYQLNEIAFTANNIIYMILMGFASGLVSMLGFDKVKQAIIQITGK